MRRLTTVRGCRRPTRGARGGSVTSMARARCFWRRSKRTEDSSSEEKAASASRFSALIAAPKLAFCSFGTPLSCLRSAVIAPCCWPSHRTWSARTSAGRRPASDEAFSRAVFNSSKKALRFSSTEARSSATRRRGSGVRGRGRGRRQPECGLGGGDDVREPLRILHRDLREDLAVHVGAGLLQARHELAVAEIMQARGRVDADDPETAELALLLLAVARRIDERPLDLQLGDAEAIVLGAVIALRELQDSFPAILPLGSTLDARHCVTPCLSFSLGVRKHRPDVLRVGFRHERSLLEAPEPARIFLREDVASHRVTALELAGRGLLEPLRRAAVRLSLRGHVRGSLSVSQCFLIGPRIRCIRFPIISVPDSACARPSRSLMSRSRTFRPLSRRDISRPRNWTVAFTLSPSSRNRRMFFSLKS